MSHFRLDFGEKELYGRYEIKKKAEQAVLLHQEYGENPSIIEMEGEYIPPTEYGLPGIVIYPDSPGV